MSQTSTVRHLKRFHSFRSGKCVSTRVQRFYQLTITIIVAASCCCTLVTAQQTTSISDFDQLRDVCKTRHVTVDDFKTSSPFLLGVSYKELQTLDRISQVQFLVARAMYCERKLQREAALRDLVTANEIQPWRLVETAITRLKHRITTGNKMTPLSTSDLDSRKFNASVAQYLVDVDPGEAMQWWRTLEPFQDEFPEFYFRTQQCYEALGETQNRLSHLEKFCTKARKSTRSDIKTLGKNHEQILAQLYLEAIRRYAKIGDWQQQSKYIERLRNLKSPTNPSSLAALNYDVGVCLCETNRKESLKWLLAVEPREKEFPELFRYIEKCYQGNKEKELEYLWKFCLSAGNSSRQNLREVAKSNERTAIWMCDELTGKYGKEGNIAQTYRYLDKLIEMAKELSPQTLESLKLPVDEQGLNEYCKRRKEALVHNELDREWKKFRETKSSVEDHLEHVGRLLRQGKDVLLEDHLYAFCIQAANEAHAAGRLNKSLEFLQLLPRQTGEANCLAIRDLLGLKLIKKAEELADIALNDKSTGGTIRADLLALAGQTALCTGKRELGLRRLRQSIDLDPLVADEGARRLLIETLHSSKLPDEIFKHVDLLKRQDISSLWFAADIAAMLNKPDKEELYLEKAIALGSAEALNTGAIRSVSVKDRARLQTLLNSPLAANLSGRSLMHIAHRCNEIGRADLARMCFERIPDHSEVEVLWASVVEEINYPGFVDLAEKHLRTLVFRHNHAKARFLLAELTAAHGKYGRALDLIDPCLHNSSDREEALTTRAKILLLSGDKKEALKTIDSLQILYPQKKYSLDDIRASISKRTVPNSRVALEVHISRVKKLADQAYTELSSTRAPDKRAELLLNAARYELLLGEGAKCLKNTNQLLACGIDNSDVRNLRAAAYELLNDETAADKERDIVVSRFRTANSRSGTFPLKY